MLHLVLLPTSLLGFKLLLCVRQETSRLRAAQKTTIKSQKSVPWYISCIKSLNGGLLRIFRASPAAANASATRVSASSNLLLASHARSSASSAFFWVS
jgi:hypothetical protein